MRSSFYGISTARSALMAQQQALELTGHNIANAGVEGYSRQRIHLKAALAQDGNGYNQPGAIGSGVQADLIQRIRDQFLDREYRLQNQQQNYHQTETEYTQRMESLMGELQDTGISKVMEDFFNAFQELSLRPEDAGIRRVVVASGNDLAMAFRSFNADVTTLQQDIDSDLNQTLTQFNNMTQKVAELNVQISRRVNAGDVPSDLLDERDRLLDQLSEMAQITVHQGPNGSVNILVDSKTVVFEDGAYALQAKRDFDFFRGDAPVTVPGTLNRGDLIINGVDIIGNDPTLTATNTGQLLDQINKRSAQTGVTAAIEASGRMVLRSSGEGSSFVKIGGTGNGVTLTGVSNGTHTLTNGSLLQLDNGVVINTTGGRIQALRDTKTEVIPATMNKINLLANGLMERVNDIHSKSYDLNGQTNRNFFTGTGAGDIAVAQTLQADPNLVAIAASAVFPPGDGSRALDIYNLRNQPVVNGQGLNEYYTTLLVDMGTRIAHAEQQSENRKLVLEQLGNQRESVSGVNLDEELSNMLQYQRSFAAATRIMNVMDEMLNQIVSGLGLGGR